MEGDGGGGGVNVVVPIGPETMISPDTIFVPGGILIQFGGGGFGALMSKAHTARYEARYEAGYRPAYKPTLRKQKA